MEPNLSIQNEMININSSGSTKERKLYQFNKSIFGMNQTHLALHLKCIASKVIKSQKKKQDPEFTRWFNRDFLIKLLIKDKMATLVIEWAALTKQKFVPNQAQVCTIQLMRQ